MIPIERYAGSRSAVAVYDYKGLPSWMVGIAMMRLRHHRTRGSGAPPPAPEVITTLTNANTVPNVLTAIAAGNQDVIELTTGAYTWQNIIVPTDRVARPLTIRPAVGAAISWVGPASTSGIIWQFGDGTHTPKWITLTGHDRLGGGSMTFRDFALASSGAIEVRGSDHLTFTWLTFTNLARDGGFAPFPRNSWCFYISGAGTGTNDHLLVDHMMLNAPAVNRDISGIQVASSGSHGAITITNILGMAGYSYGLYFERPISALLVDGVVMSDTGDASGPASINVTGAVAIAGTIQNVTGTGGCLPYRDVHSGGGVVATSNISIA